MLRGIAACARVFGRDDWRTLALRNAEFLDSHVAADGTIARILSRSASPRAGFLEDHAAVALAFVDVWQLTSDRRWLDRAAEIAGAVGRLFHDEQVGGFFDVSRDHEALITRPRDLYDNATPSGSSLAVELFLTLGYVIGDDDMTRRAERALAPLVEPMARHPHAFGHALCCADMTVRGVTAVAIVGSEKGIRALESIATQPFVPGAIVARTRDGENADLAIFRDRTARGDEAAAYVCRGAVCDAPVTSGDELTAQLRIRA
jgi:uncharacterized protein YyaL (SSP411 family)